MIGLFAGVYLLVNMGVVVLYLLSLVEDDQPNRTPDDINIQLLYLAFFGAPSILLLLIAFMMYMIIHASYYTVLFLVRLIK